MIRLMTCFFLAVACALSISGCFLDIYGREEVPEGYTSVQFSAGHAAKAVDSTGMESAQTTTCTTSPCLKGGLMIYMVGINGTPFRTVFPLGNETQTVSFALPNGSYRGFAIGYSYPNFGGPVKCGFAERGDVLVLNGGTKTINIEMNDSYCSYDPIAPQPVQIVTSPPPTCPSTVCAVIGSQATSYLSFKVRFPVYSGQDGTSLGGGIESACLPFFNTNLPQIFLPVPKGALDPWGNLLPDVPIFKMEIKAFSDSTCFYPPVARFFFPDGLANPNSALGVNVTTGSSVPVTVVAPSGTYPMQIQLGI